jgi:hypothetical protein
MASEVPRSPLSLSLPRPMLLFKKKFLPAIRAGEKTQTIRLWKWRQMRAGQRSYIPGAGYVRIDGVDEVQIADLSDADAVPDGFPTAEALRHELTDIYGERIAAGYKAFRVVFHVTEPVVPKDARAKGEGVARAKPASDDEASA